MLWRKKHTNVEPAAGSQSPSATSIPRPWEDRTLSSQHRYDSYMELAKQKGEAIKAAMLRPGITTDEQTAIRLNPESQFWYQELKQLRAETPERFCWRIDVGPLQELLGKNFLGTAQWQQGFQVDVGVVPPIPKSITTELLQSECPLHPGEKIKDTHILMLLPKTVNGEPYSALKLGELCAKRKGSGEKLIYDGEDWAKAWKSQDWAKAQQAQSEWVLLPKSDPDPKRVPQEKHFRSKNIAAQQSVHTDHYGDYREAKALEVMTAALLNDVVNEEPRMLAPIEDNWNYLRCVEPNASGGRVLVGGFSAIGLKVRVGLDAFGHDAFGHDGVGRALAWKSQS
jgi:hypothetical protein